MGDLILAVGLGAAGGWVGGRLLSVAHLALLRREDRVRRGRGAVSAKHLIRHRFEGLLWLPGAAAGGLASGWGLGAAFVAGALVVPGAVAVVVVVGHLVRSRP